VHRDLKLPNVMAVAGDDLVVKIIDFGLSRVSRNTLDGSGHNLKVKAAGTMSTAAPEVARGGRKRVRNSQLQRLISRSFPTRFG